MQINSLSKIIFNLITVNYGKLKYNLRKDNFLIFIFLNHYFQLLTYLDSLKITIKEYFH